MGLGLRTVAPLVGLLLASVLGAANASGGGRRADSGVTGRVVPCGIVLERPAACAVAGTPATVAVGHGERVVRRQKVRPDGSFRVRLEAGAYWVQARTAKTRGPRVRATVTAGEWVSVTLIAGRSSPPGGR
jgi:hypothetical protein